jgi:signal transduction histidine kinase
MIMAECDRQIDMVLNLLDLSRIEAGTFNIALSRVDVADVVNSCSDSERRNAEARGDELVVRLPERLPAVMADRAALRRVFCGLVQNAIKYTPDGGRITLAAEAAAGEVRISVSDTGRGIPEEDIPRIFEKFYRGHGTGAQATALEGDSSTDSAAPPGVGLGLYLARTVVEEIGGRIEVKSRIGDGTVFTIVLPAWDNRDDDKARNESTASDG